MAHHAFSSGDTLARNLANDVAAALGRRLAADGTAGLVVSGGRTPAAFLRALASRELGWRARIEFGAGLAPTIAWQRGTR
mgnify:CR=1 FL=1